MSAKPVIIHVDGAARGNPGPAAFAFVITPPGQSAIEEFGLLGETTNNVAEYTALLNALEKAASLSLDDLHIHSDSELMVKQLKGEYRVKNAELRELYDAARDLIRGFKSVRVDHVRREQNKRADELCNLALDGGKPKTRTPAKKSGTVSTKNVESVRQECIDCLDAVKKVWAAHDPGAPRPDQVWEQIWSILEESGVLKKTSKE